MQCPYSVRDCKFYNVTFLVVTCYGAYSVSNCSIVRDCGFSALSLGFCQAWLLVDLASDINGISKIQYFSSTELLCLYYILFSQSVGFCTQHICHIALSYIWPLPSSPRYLTRWDNLFLMNFRLQIRCETIFCMHIFYEVLCTWLQVRSHNCYKPLLASPCLSVSLSVSPQGTYRLKL